MAFARFDIPARSHAGGADPPPGDALLCWQLPYPALPGNAGSVRPSARSPHRASPRTASYRPGDLLALQASSRFSGADSWGGVRTDPRTGASGYCGCLWLAALPTGAPVGAIGQSTHLAGPVALATRSSLVPVGRFVLLASCLYSTPLRGRWQASRRPG